MIIFAYTTQEYAINPAIDECARAENAIKANSTCSSAFTSVISILSAGARGVTIVQLDGYFNIMCQGSCGDLVSRYFTACEAKIVSLCTNTVIGCIYLIAHMSSVIVRV